jgi:hypothetical protein
MITLFTTNGLPGLLRGASESEEIPAVPYCNIDMASMDLSYKKEDGKVGVDQRRVEVEFNAGVLAQVLAKIAHSYAVSHLGLGAFEPFLQSYSVQQDTPRVDTHRIGGLSLGTEQCVHSISLYLFPVGLARYWVVRIHLFAWRNPLVYFVAVGRPR